MQRRSPLFSTIAAVGFLALAGCAVLVRAVSAAEAAPASDPVIGEVVRLLEAHLGEPLIVRWLEEAGEIPGRVSADDLVALKRAGASDQLIAFLLDLAKTSARRTPVPSAPKPAPAAAAPQPPAQPAAQAPAYPTPTVPALATPSATSGSAVGADRSTVLVSATLRYVHVADEGEPWNLVVYLDGVPFAPLVASASATNATTSTSERRLAPGRHVLRWAQERHRERREERGLHAARFDPEPLVFELAAGSPAEIEFEFRDRSGMFLRFGNPVTARVSQEGREIAALRPGGDPAAWPLLCEDYEANLGGKKPNFDDRRTLRRCLRWIGLWPGIAAVPSREQVRPPVQ